MVIFTVDTDGISGDYSSLNSAVANLPATLNDDYTIEVSASTSVADTTPTTISIDTNGHTLTLKPSTGQEHSGVFDTSKYYAEAEEFLIIETGNVIVDGLQIRQSVCTDRYRELLTLKQSSGSVTVQNSILTTINPDSDCSAIWSYNAKGDIFLVNNLVYGWNQHENKGYWISSSSLVDEYHYIYNCTFVDCTWSIRPESITEEYVIAKNTGVAGTWTQSFGDISHPMTTISCSDSDPVFLDSLNNDYHLDLTDTVWKEQGSDLSSDVNYNVTEDFEGELRGSVFDIGADQSETIMYDELIGNDIISTSSVESSNITQNHSFSTLGISSTSIVDSPSITLQSNLSANSITAVFTIESPNITQDHNLSSLGVITTNIFESPYINFLLLPKYIKFRSNINSYIYLSNTINETPTYDSDVVTEVDFIG